MKPSDCAEAHLSGAENRRPRVLIVHNRYQEPGGEDAVFEAEAGLLRRFGHDVELYERHNDELNTYPRWHAALDTFWSPRTVDELTTIAVRFRPEIVHVHNSFPLVSPSVYWGAARSGAAVVQTLHNFRLLCPQGIFLRDGVTCQDCLGHVPWRAIVHGCYRGSRRQSAVVAAMLAGHRAIGTYRERISRYIALTEFARDKFIAGGLPARKIAVKPNFVEDEKAQPVAARAGGLFVGRLSRQKGIELLIDALARCQPRPPFCVAGAGELDAVVKATLGDGWKGLLSTREVLVEMRRAAFLVLPSVGFEGFPRTIVEAYCCGLPVIASRAGPLAQIVVEGETGLLFEPGDASDLARAIQWATTNPGALRRMGEAARREYERRYSAEQNYLMLNSIYLSALSD